MLLSFPFFFWKDWRPWRTRLFLAYVPRYPDTAPAPPIPFSLYNISFDSYIKPQRFRPCLGSRNVVYLLIPTSNHNGWKWHFVFASLYIFWFLHQTTTTSHLSRFLDCCISFDSYIKPQLWDHPPVPHCRCISFDSYIKPQRWYACSDWTTVVYLLIPTSNHNLKKQTTDTDTVVYLLIPTSNHNSIRQQRSVHWVVYLLIPTSNHNWESCEVSKILLYIFWFLHQTTTCLSPLIIRNKLYIFWFLHQTTTIYEQEVERLQLYIFWFLHQTTTIRTFCRCSWQLYIFWFLHQTTTWSIE